MFLDHVQCSRKKYYLHPIMYYMVPYKSKTRLWRDTLLSHLQLWPVAESRLETLAATNSVIVGIVGKGNQKIRRAEGLKKVKFFLNIFECFHSFFARFTLLFEYF